MVVFTLLPKRVRVFVDAHRSKQQFVEKIEKKIEKKSRFNFNHNALRWQPQCFAVFGLLIFSLSRRAVIVLPVSIITFYPTHTYLFLTVSFVLECDFLLFFNIIRTDVTSVLS